MKSYMKALWTHMLESDQFLAGNKVIEALEQHGFEAFFVGGCVRDTLLNRQIKDVDVATNALPQQVKEIFQQTFDIGIAHGTVLVRLDNESIEVTTYRSEEQYEDFRRPTTVSFVSDLKEDLLRRDFTMNAIAMSRNGEIIDYFNGAIDIRNKVIRAVGKASERFQEDALRMLRAIRFSSTLGFAIEENTMTAMQKHAQLLQHISVERITAEMNKFFLGDQVENSWYQLINSMMLKAFPIKVDRHDHFIKFPFVKNAIQGWVIIYSESDGKKDVPQAFKFSKTDKKTYIQLIQAIELRQERPFEINDLFGNDFSIFEFAEYYYATMTNANVEQNVINLKILWDSMPIHSRQQLAITGSHLTEWINKRQGPWVNELLHNLEQRVLKGTLRNEIDCMKGVVLHENLDETTSMEPPISS